MKFEALYLKPMFYQNRIDVYNVWLARFHSNSRNVKTFVSACGPRAHEMGSSKA